MTLRTENVLEILHEIGVLATMLLFVWSGGSLMSSYTGNGDFLPILAGLALMLAGAFVILRSPRRWRDRAAEYYDVHPAEQGNDDEGAAEAA